MATGRMLDGARLYVDIIEVNPPLAFYLTVPPVAAARLIGISSEAALISYVFVLIVGSLVLVHRLLSAQPGVSVVYRGVMLLASAGALTIAPLDVFGQREHLMLILALPYIFLFAARLNDCSCDRRFAVLIGMLAAIGFALKPHFFLVPAAFELRLAIHRRSPTAILRAETWSVSIVTVLYAVFVAAVHPEYLEFIVSNAGLVYESYSSSLRAVVMQPIVFVTFAIIGLHVAARAGGAVDRASDAFGIATVGFLVAYVVQSKGWQYQLLPAAATAWLTAAAIVAQLSARSRAIAISRRRFLPPIASGAMATLVLLLVANGTYHNRVAEALLPDVERYAPHGTIYAFSASVSVGFPLVNAADVRWASRFPAQWLLPGALRRLASPAPLRPDTARHLREIEHYAVDAVIEDLERMPPDLVIVDKFDPYFGNLEFDFQAYFSRDPRFVELWRLYTKMKTVTLTMGGMRREFDIWCRRDATHRCVGGA